MRPILDPENFEWLMDEMGIRGPERGLLHAICVQGVGKEQLPGFLDLTPEAVGERLSRAQKVIAGHVWQHPLVRQKELLLRLLHNREGRPDHLSLGLDVFRSGSGAPAYGEVPAGAARVVTGYDLAFGERSWREASETERRRRLEGLEAGG